MSVEIDSNNWIFFSQIRSVESQPSKPTQNGIMRNLERRESERFSRAAEKNDEEEQPPTKKVVASYDVSLLLTHDQQRP